MNNVGVRIKNLRIEQGFTQENFAHKAGLSRSTLANYELARREPDLKTLSVIARHLHTSIAFLVGETDDPKPAPNQRKSDFVLDRINQLCSLKGISFESVLAKTNTSVDDLMQLDPGRLNPRILWPIARTLGTNMSYIVGATDRMQPILAYSQTDTEETGVRELDDKLDPEDAWDLEQAYLTIKKRKNK